MRRVVGLGKSISLDRVNPPMVLWKAVKYAALAVGLVVLAAAAVSVLTWLLVSVVWPLLVTLAILLAAAAGTYAVTKAALWLYRTRRRQRRRARAVTTSREATSHESGSTPEDPIDRLNEQYVNGDLSEEEFERRLELELRGGRIDEIDRELERAQSN
ncbi:MAG: hypothetical protein ACOCR0_01015 [Haloferacaceae archaeon]